MNTVTAAADKKIRRLPVPPRETSLPKVHGALYPRRLWRNADTLVLGAGIFAVAGAMAVSVLIGAPLLLATVTVSFVVLLATLLVGVRRLIASQEEERRQAQALAALHAILPLRAPLPPLSGWAATPELAAKIVELILTDEREQIVELGSGVSTLVAAYCFEVLGKGHVTSLDHDADYAAVTRHNLEQHGLSHRATVLDAPLCTVELEGGKSVTWYDDECLSLEKVDLLVVDGPPAATQSMARYLALPRMWKRLASGAAIVLDDARRADEQRIVEMWGAEHDELRVEWVDSHKGIAVLHRG